MGEFLKGLSFVGTYIIVPGGLAAFGAWLAFQYDRKKRREENEFCLKQEAFFDAAEAVQRFFIYYMTIPDRTLPRDGKTDPEDIPDGRHRV